jgi:hypothetical protein
MTNIKEQINVTDVVYIGFKAPLTERVIAVRMALMDVEVCIEGGGRALVTGYRLPFARVTNVDTGRTDEFSWESVQRVVNGSRRFSL